MVPRAQDRDRVRPVRRVELPPRARILDAGCGSGRNMLELRPPRDGDRAWSSRRRAPRSRASATPARSSPARCWRCPSPTDSFDLAVSLDVIEHLDDDLGALRELRRVVAPGGALLVTVPAYQWLWSGHDEHQPPPSPLHPPLAAGGGRAGRLAAGAHHLLQLAAAAGRDPAAGARPLQHARRPSRASICGCPPSRFNWLLERPLVARGGA